MASKGSKKVKATFDYLATEPGELSIRKGDVIVVLEEDATGWWKGQSADGLVGFFPSNFSELLPEEGAPPAAQLRRMSMAPKPARDDARTQAEERVRAKHNYKGSPADGELSFAKGDIIRVLNKDESGWWKGDLNGRTGFFPHNFVVALDKAAPAAKGPKKTAAAASKAPADGQAPAGDAKAAAAAQERAEAAERRAQEAQAAARAAEERAQEAEAAAKAAEQRAAQADVRAAEAEQKLQQLRGAGVGDLDVNQLRGLKHELKEGLGTVQKALETLKACPGCEGAVKDCIIVPCLHAFCHKCGEKAKRAGKCVTCGVAPERIYLLGGKK